jgi:3-hydroxyphenylacetate 6-hydroxylase
VLSNTAGTTIGTSPYSDSLKRRRKGVESALSRPSGQTYVTQIDVETKVFCNELLKYGNAGAIAVDLMPMIQRLSLALTLNWGIRMDSQEHKLFDESLTWRKKSVDFGARLGTYKTTSLCFV